MTRINIKGCRDLIIVINRFSFVAPRHLPQGAVFKNLLYSKVQMLTLQGGVTEGSRIGYYN